MISEALRAVRDKLTTRAQAYRRTFAGPVPGVVLRDLARFCRANETTVVPGQPEASKILEGRREVWLRIQHHLQLTDEQLWDLYDGRG